MDKNDVRYLDLVDLFSQFSEKLECAANESTLAFIARRMDFLNEEVQELQEAIDKKDYVEIVDGAADVAFIAITQIYHAFRNKGFEHYKAVIRTREALLEVGLTNIIKIPPTKKGEKIKKPDDWQPPKIKELFERK